MNSSQGSNTTYTVSGETSEWEDILIKHDIKTKEEVLELKGLNPKDFEKKPLKLTSGNLSHKELANMAAKYGLTIGRTPITTSLAPGTKDASPIPSDSLCCQQKRLLVNNISTTDTLIIVDDPKYLDEIASWEGHAENLNMVKIGKELIHYLGISEEEPYRLLNVERGYWGTTPTEHSTNDTICNSYIL